jgi:hypothetical protein
VAVEAALVVTDAAAGDLVFTGLRTVGAAAREEAVVTTVAVALVAGSAVVAAVARYEQEGEGAEE